MRGVTFKNTFVILDEANNATEEQLRMFVTRFGEGSKFVINGDPNQSDLHPRLRGAFEQFMTKLDGLELVGIVRLDDSDIVRHSLIKQILARL